MVTTSLRAPSEVRSGLQSSGAADPTAGWDGLSSSPFAFLVLNGNVTAFYRINLTLVLQRLPGAVESLPCGTSHTPECPPMRNCWILMARGSVATRRKMPLLRALTEITRELVQNRMYFGNRATCLAARLSWTFMALIRKEDGNNASI
jgi:hypothetical protein